MHKTKKYERKSQRGKKGSVTANNLKSYTLFSSYKSVTLKAEDKIYLTGQQEEQGGPFMRSDNIDMLQETLQILDRGSYRINNRTVKLKLSKTAMETVHVLLPEDVQDICGRTDFEKVHRAGKCEYRCVNEDSFTAARQQYQSFSHLFDQTSKPVLVLNLASPVHPGGGVRRGAKAQEEDLCRQSSLLLSLESRQAAKYYEYNKRLQTRMGSDAIIFTPEVEIIRDEDGKLLDETVIVAVLTCAAPMVRQGKEGMREEVYQGVVYNRIMGMLKCAAYFGYENLVLGAWGCGAFGNDAHVMSDLFCKALNEMEYNGLREKDFFRRIDFAVLDRTAEQYNFKEFHRNFAFGNYQGEEKRNDFSTRRIAVTDRKSDNDTVDSGTGAGSILGARLGYDTIGEKWKSNLQPEAIHKTKIILVKGDITKDHGVQAIVNAANTSLLGGGGVDGAIHRAAGPGLLAECRILNGCKTGRAKITKAYRLPCEYVIHTPGPHWNGGRSKEHELLASCYQSCLELAVANGVQSIAFPSISTGIYHFPLDEAAKIAIRTAQEFVAEHPGELDVIKWVLFDDQTFESYKKELERWEVTRI